MKGAVMSVVPWVLRESIVETQPDFQAAGGVNGKAALVTNLQVAQLNSSKTSNVSYDLRVGPKYRPYTDPKEADLSEGQHIRLRPGDAVLIQTEESVHLPKYLFGYVVPKVGLLQKGITNTLSKVDPGYHGPLIVTLFNLGTTDQKVAHGDPFCALILHRVDEGSRPYEDSSKQIVGTPPRERWWRRCGRKLLENKTWLPSTVISVAALIVAILTYLHRAR
jgi:deoxycytidine triphosphate deaminase